jgi:hypothetical protein
MNLKSMLMNLVITSINSVARKIRAGVATAAQTSDASGLTDCGSSLAGLGPTFPGYVREHRRRFRDAFCRSSQHFGIDYPFGHGYPADSLRIL